MSLRSKIATIATLLVLAAIVVNTLLQTYAARQAVLQQARDGGDSIAAALARAVAFAAEVPAQPGESADGQAQTRRLVTELVAGDVREVRILDSQSTTLVSRRIDDRGHNLLNLTGRQLLVGE